MSERFVGLTAELPPLQISRAVRQLGEPTFYFSDPEADRACVGFGLASLAEARSRTEALSLLERLTSASHVRWLESANLGAPPGPWFGGFAFDLARMPGASLWPGFPVSRWTLPELLLWVDHGKWRLTAFRPEHHSRRALQEDLWTAGDRLVASAAERVSDGPLRPARSASERSGFESRVQRALSAVQAGRLKKVVVARAIELTLEQGEFDPFSVALRLTRSAPRCATFLVAGEGGSAFVGATPETLCTVKGRELETEALAGTAARVFGESPDVTAIRLLASEKDRREQQEVVDGILHALQPVTSALAADALPSPLALKSVVHLRTGFRGELREGMGVSQVVRALHPTPAVGGWPRAPTFGFLAEEERLDRGWYAGAVGYLGENAAHLRVAIRSAMIAGARAHVFVGAGVVAGSTPEGEWAETEAKARAMLEALEVRHG